LDRSVFIRITLDAEWSAPMPQATRPGRLTVPVLALCAVLMAVMQTAIVPLLPELSRLTGASLGAVSWMVTATLLAGAVFTPILGRAGDMYGKKGVLLFALGLMTAGSLVCAATSDIGLLIAGRALQGTAAAVVPLAISILRDELPPERIGSGIALMSSSIGIGAALGLPASTAIVQYTDWHAMFLVAGGLGVVGLVLVWIVVPQSPVRRPGRFDVPGALLLTGWLMCLLLAVSQGGDWGWSSPTVLGLLGGGAALLAGWWWLQLRTPEPLVDVRLTVEPRVALPHLAALFTGFAFFANSILTSQLLQAPRSTGYGLGLGILHTGLLLLPGGIVMLVLSPVSAAMSKARGPRLTLATGAAVIALGYAVRIVDSRSLLTIVAGTIVLSGGTALAYSALPALIMEAVPVEQTASVNGVNVLARTIGQAMSSAAIAAVLSHYTLAATGRPSLQGFEIAFGVAGTIGLVACATALAVPGRRGKAVTGPARPARPATTEGVSGP
jgi:predicted MFS family arabinose efflux permease